MSTSRGSGTNALQVLFHITQRDVPHEYFEAFRLRVTRLTKCDDISPEGGLDGKALPPADTTCDEFFELSVDPAADIGRDVEI